MNAFRSWSRRAYLLHGYLIAMMALLPMPPSQLAWAEEEDPPPEPPPEEEVWSYNHSESMDSVTLGSSGSAPEGGEVTLQALVETNSWEVWTSSFGNVRTENYVTQPNTSAWVSWSQVSGGGYLTSASNWTDSFGLAGATFVMSSGPAEVRAEVIYGSAKISVATLWLEQTWSFSGYGSGLHSVQWLEVEGGTGGLVPGDQRTLVAEVQESSWEVWTNNGETEARNTTYAPAMNAPVTFYIQSGDGSLDSLLTTVTVMTDGQGRAQTTFAMGPSATMVGVVAGEAGQGQVEGGSVEFQSGSGAVSEWWSFSHTEDSFALSLEAPGGVPQLAAGQAHTLLARAEVTTWQVFTSNYGNMDYREPYTQPAAWLPLYLWVMEGDGVLVEPPVTAGEDGTAEVNLQMGTGSTRVQALLPDGNGGALALAELDLAVLAEEWWLVREEGTLLLNLAAGGAQTGLAPGEQRSVAAEVRYQGWEVWSNGVTEEFRNDFDRAAQGAVLTFAVESGDGTVDAGPVSTDTEGRAAVTFTMGQQASLLRGDAWFGATISSAATLDFSLPEDLWNFERHEEALDVEMLHTPGTSMVTVRVSQATWDVYVLASDPAQTRVEKRTSSPAMNAEVGFSISSGTVGTATTWTNEDGYATTSFQTAEAAAVTASVAFAGMAGSGTAEVEANPLVITTTTLPPGAVGADYTTSIQVANGTAPYNFHLITKTGENGLPFGYTLLSDGTLTGYGDSSTGSQQAGSYTFTVEVNDNAGQTAQQQLTLELLPMSVPPLTISTTALPPMGVGLPYAANVQVTGSQSEGGVAFSVDALPPGMTFDNNGLLSGSVPVVGSYTFNVTAQEMGTGGELRSATAALTLVVASPEVAIVSGNGQVAWGGDVFEPLTVRLSVAGLPVAGAQVTFDGVPVITDAGGMAQWTPGAAPAALGVFTIAANSGNTGVTFTLGSAGLPMVPDGPPIQVNPVVGDPAPPAKVSLADAETAVESRWVSTKRGSVQATYSAGTAFGFVNGQWTTFVEGWGPPPYDASGTRWTSSKSSEVQTTPPPAPSGLDGEDAWEASAVTASIIKYPNTPSGPVEGSELGSGFTLWPEWTSSSAAVRAFGAWYGSSTDRSEETAVEVRLKRAGTGTEPINRTFIAITEEDGVFKGADPVTLTIAGADAATNTPPAIESPPHLLTVTTAETGKQMTKRLLPVEFKTYPDTEPGPDKAHKKNLTTRQDETAKHGVGWEKVVCKIWDSSPGKVNLIDYLDGGPGNHSTYENVVKWQVNGTEQMGHELSLGPKPGEDEHTHFYVQVMPKNGGDTLDRLIITVVPPETKTKFDNWYAAESTAAGKAWFAECPRMPSSLELSPLQSPDRLFSPRIWRDPKDMSAIGDSTYFHPDAYYEIRAKKTPGGHGHQATFGTTGTLILTSVSAGTADKAAAFPENWNYNLHVDADVTPFMWALQLDGNPCDQSTTTLTMPMLHEGAFIKKYMECRPPEPNAKPRFAPGGAP